jgi:hypothetical protein
MVNVITLIAFDYIIFVGTLITIPFIYIDHNHEVYIFEQKLNVEK